MTDFQFWFWCAVFVFFSVPSDKRSWSRMVLALVLVMLAVFSLGAQSLLEDKEPRRPIVVMPK